MYVFEPGCAFVRLIACAYLTDRQAARERVMWGIGRGFGGGRRRLLRLGPVAVWGL